MNLKYVAVLVCTALLAGCGSGSKPTGLVMFTVNGYNVTLAEFNEGFDRSDYADREDIDQARAEYAEKLINQKLILLDAQKKGLDQDKEFLKSIEHLWEQSLSTMAVGRKLREIDSGLTLSEQEIRRFYENMVKSGITTKSYEDVYPQIKAQAQKQMESRLLDEWIKSLRSGATIDINKNLLKMKP
ncbi:MAG: hypothetical protein HQL22_11510 [Candidatus Omnitrophica bacterium]|nr:hypothetical protein [Candidatus Omnitrophota bacterium]